MQVAARQVLEENARLRQVLKRQGMSEQEINSLAASDNISGLNVSGLFSPAQALVGQLNSRKSCSDCSDSTTGVKQECGTSQNSIRKASSTSMPSDTPTDARPTHRPNHISGDQLSEPPSSYQSQVKTSETQQSAQFQIPPAASSSAPQPYYSQFQNTEPDPLSRLPSSLSSLLQIWPEYGEYQGRMVASAQDQSPQARSDQSFNTNQAWGGLEPLNDCLESLMTPEQRSTFTHYLSMQRQNQNQSGENEQQQDFEQNSNYSKASSMSLSQPFGSNSREETSSNPAFSPAFHDSPHTHPMCPQYEGSESNSLQPAQTGSLQLDQPAINMWQNSAYCHRTAEWKQYDDPCWQECSMLARQIAEAG